MCRRTYILFFQMSKTFGALLLQMKLRQLKFLSHYNDYNFNFSNYWLEFYIICTFFKFSASPPLRVIVPHYKKKKRGGGILSSLLISEFWSKSLSLPLSLSVSPSSVLHYIMVYEMPAGLGALVQYPIMNWTLFLVLSKESYPLILNGIGYVKFSEILIPVL